MEIIYSFFVVSVLVHDVTRNIKDIRQLKGRSLAVGPKGSGVRRISERILKFYGIDKTNTKFIETQILDAEEALINRRIDAAFFLLPARTPIVKNLATRHTLKLLNISESEALSHFIDPLEHVIVPKGAFKISPLIPHKNLDAIALPISIIISDNAGMGLGALVAAILKDKYPKQTFYSVDEDLPKFSYQGIKRLSAAEEISDRIDSVESVAEALFTEWQAELDEYTSASLRRDSERQLRATRGRYQRLMTSMHGA